MRNTGIVLIVIGLLMMVVTGFNYVTREKVVDVGPVHISKTKDNPVEWSPILGGAILIAGIAIVATNRNSKS